jgi:hypothetical protein
MIDRRTFPAVLALVALALILAIPGCNRGHRHGGGPDCPTVEHGNPLVGPGPKNCGGCQ